MYHVVLSSELSTEGCFDRSSGTCHPQINADHCHTLTSRAYYKEACLLPLVVEEVKLHYGATETLPLYPEDSN